jgi:predicted amidophosphoribosyltransferase
MSSGYGAKEARYVTRLSKGNRGQINLCGSCGDEIAATELLCPDCRGTLRPTEPESEGEEARRTR